MRRIHLLFAGLLISCLCFSQSKFLTKNGHISFYSHTSVEDIKADNNQVAAILNTENSELVITVLMKSFKFERALMEEHFNENYVESDKYPSAKFKGKILNADFKKKGIQDVDIQGDMTIHGTTKNITAKGNIEVKDDAITGKSKFLIKPGDYNIEIPSVVKEKFADNMEVTVELNFSPMK